MNTKNILVIIALTAVFLHTSAAQIDTTRREFFPLHIGDLWQYRDENQTLAIQRVIGDTIIDGQHYFLLMHSLLTSGGGILRVDSLMRVEIYGGAPGGGICSFYRLAEPDSSIWPMCYNFYGMLTPTPLVRFDGIFLRGIFGQVRETMDFSFGGVIETGDTLLSYGATLVRGIGIFHERYYFAGAFYQLYGAIINGVQYGTIVGVDDMPTTIPERFVLHQNYPNPFNSSTTIQYDLPKRTYVRLTVHDALGREVARLVEQMQIAGRYQVAFDASNLASGVYIYVLRIGNFLMRRHMILIK